ncbi:hypothetical protein JCM10908_004398 [Rhodotorula pacifica]|uniref:PQ-loop repeat-containing protein n=1 Tax=Rhodotorula pacifica TaxID=1495444 RepID=UPI00317D4265
MSAAEAGGAAVGWLLDRDALSTYLGLASIVTWLGAQSPQIYENFKRGSVEGLALPFLVSWFVGDFTNFLGCVLTHQLPFQTYLAGYFLLVDVALCSQFAYYSRVHPVPAIPPFAEDFPYAQAHPPHIHRHSGTRSRSRKPRRSTSRLTRSRSALAQEEEEGEGGEGNPMAATWMTEGSGHSSSDATASPHFSARRTASASLLNEELISPISSVPPSPVQQPERGRTLHRAAVRTFDPTLAPICGSPSSQGAFMTSYQQAMNGNHVSFSRNAEQFPALPPPPPPPAPLHHAVESAATHSRHRTTSSQSRPPISRRSTSSIMFLSVGALMTLGSLGGSTAGAGVSPLRRRAAEQGRVWAAEPPATVRTDSPAWSPPQLGLRPRAMPVLDDRRQRRQISDASTSTVERSTIFPLEVPEPADSFLPPTTSFLEVVGDSAADSSVSNDRPHREHPHHEPHPPDWERIIGRTSAWTCTTAYLTSRLPQIWQNFRRRSVEGLAMTLFLFAFIGNSLYVASILANPQSSSVSFLLESLPYLLGSGGTLCFDLMILGQSWLYSEKRRARRAHDRRKRAARGLDAEEEAALLHADGETEEEDLRSPAVTRSGRFSRDNKRVRKPSAGSSYRTATRSRSTSTLGFGRSMSTSTRGANSRPVSTNGRSNSTEMYTGRTPSASSRDDRRALSRSERGILRDDPFEWDSAVAVTPTTPSTTGPSSPFHSRRPSIEIADTIPEEGESGLTIRAG